MFLHSSSTLWSLVEVIAQRTNQKAKSKKKREEKKKKKRALNSYCLLPPANREVFPHCPVVFQAVC